VELKLRLPRVGSGRINDPDLDMRREQGRARGSFSQVWYALKKSLGLHDHGPASPMRSVAREAEESWPAGD
jgi:hypothetical protein